MKPCIWRDPLTGVSCGVLSDGSRCPEHTRRKDHDRGSASSRGYGAKWRALMAQKLREHRARFGDVCPGYHVPPHSTDSSNPLSGHHRIPLSKGGDLLDPDNVIIYCRACNDRIGTEIIQPGSEGQEGPPKVEVARPKRFLVA